MGYIESYGMRELDQDEVNAVSGGYIPVGATIGQIGGGIAGAGFLASAYGAQANSSFWTNLGNFLQSGGVTLGLFGLGSSWL